MATTVVLNGVNYTIPATGDSNWGDTVSQYLIAISSTVLQKTGGVFTLTGDVDFGTSFGIKSSYFTSKAANPAATGAVRLASADAINFRNNANSADIALGKDTSDNLSWGGVSFLSSAGALLPAGFPALTGDVTTTAGSVATSVAQIQGTAISGTTGSGNVVLSASPTFTGSITAAALALSSALGVSSGGTGLASGTSGGVLYFSSSTGISSSAALTANQLIVGGGAGSAPVTLAAGSQYQSLVMGASAPGYGAVNLSQSAAITGNLPLTNIATIAGNTVLGNATGSSASPATLTLASSASASSVLYRDANANTQVNNLIENGASTATAAGTTTLTAASAYFQQFTGSTTQIVVLPAANTLTLYQSFCVANRSSGVVTVNANGGGLIQTMAAGTQCIFTVTNISSGAGSWDAAYSSTVATGTVTSITVTVPSFLSVSGSPITTSGTIALSLSGTALPIANGGTGQTTALAAFDALSPLTTEGDLHYFASGHNARLPLGSSGQVLKVVGSDPTWATFSGGINYVSSNPDAEANTSGWNVYSEIQLCSVSSASPAVATVTDTSKLTVGTPFTLEGGTAGTGTTSGTTYYITTIISGTTFNFSASLGGSNVNTTGASSGAQYFAPAIPTTGTNLSGSVSSITIATPGVVSVSSTAGMYKGMPFQFSGAIGSYTGFSINTTYYICTIPGGGTTFTFSTTLANAAAGTNVAVGGSSSGATLTYQETAAGITFARSTSSPLRGTASFLITQSNSTVVQGTGVNYDFTIDSADQAKVLSIQFDFNASSTFVASSGQTGSDSDVEVYIYDKTNGVLIPVSPKVITANGSNNYTFKAIFQTSSNSTSYRLILHNATSNANSTGWAFKYDNVAVGPQTILQGPAMTDWTAYSMTVGATSSAPTLGGSGSVTSGYRRVGDHAEIRVIVYNPNAGSAGTGTYLFPLPPGLSLDTNKASVTTNGSGVNGSALGYGLVASTTSGAATNAYAAATVIAYNTGNLALQIPFSTINEVTQYGAGFLGWNGASYAEFTALVPISGWSSNCLMSNDANTKVVAASYYISASTQAPGNATPFNFDTQLIDTSGAVTTGAGAWKFIAPVSGDYGVSLCMKLSSTVGELNLYKNGSINTQIVSATSNGNSFSGHTLIKLTAGDYIDIRPDVAMTVSGGTGPFNSVISIGLLSGPAAIAATESVNATYSGAPATGTLTNSYNAVTFPTKVKDTHGGMSGSTYTIPSSGSFSISALVSVAATYTTGQITAVRINKNGSPIATQAVTAGDSISAINPTVTIASYPFVTGDTVQILVFCSGGTPSYASGADQNLFSISRVGN